MPAERFGMAIVTLDGRVFAVGDAHTRFSIQSISRLFAFSPSVNNARS